MADPATLTLSGGLLWRIFGGIWKWIRGRRLSSEEKVRAHQRWRGPFFDYLVDRWKNELREDSIIRDIARADLYPDDDDKKGISSWFRVGLLETYHRGIKVGLGWYGLRQDKPRRRWYDIKAPPDELHWRLLGKGEQRVENEENFALVGFIRFDNIEEVIWDGDEYYGYPHIYCHFDAKGKTPYERLSYCRKQQSPGPSGRSFYTEVAEQEAVWKFTKRCGIRSI
jgi:hypothetical protein